MLLSVSFTVSQMSIFSPQLFLQRVYVSALPEAAMGVVQEFQGWQGPHLSQIPVPFHNDHPLPALQDKSNADNCIVSHAFPCETEEA